MKEDDEMRIYDGNELEKYKKKPYRVPRRLASDNQRKRPSESRFAKTLVKHLKLYCKYSKLAGLKYFADPKMTLFDRTLLIVLYSIIVPIMTYAIYHEYKDFFDNPCVTSVDTEYFPTQDLDFPGVAICSINRISREAALEMANEIFELNITDLPVERILEMFSQLGNLYDSEFRITERSYQIDQLLAEFYKGSYDVTDILKRLTPQCSNVISRCRFHGENKNCSKVFETRKTQDGFCCTFNYAIKKDDRSLNNGVDLRLDPLKVENFGEDQGLSVLLEPLLDDYFYPIFPITGWKVMVFNPHDYPDMNSGGLIEIFVPLETYQNVELDAIVSYGTRNILPYSLEHRKCVFPEEMTSPNASYTYSDCLVDCTIQDVWQTCKCIPFYLPNHDSKRVCNLQDLPCLSIHKFKWYTAVPNADLRDVKNNTQILHCNRCYPLCSGVTYNAKTFEARLNRGRHQSKLLDGVDCVQQSAVHLYFNHFGTIKLKQNVVDQWYELLSDASGIGGIFIGFSLIAIVEFGYFVGLFVWELLKGPTSSDGIDNKTKRKRPALQIIYWGELYPRTRPDIITNQHGRFPNKY